MMKSRFLTMVCLTGLVLLSSGITAGPHRAFIQTAAKAYSLITPTPSTLPSLPTPTPLSPYTLPFPGILPDHPLYILKVSRDRLVLLFTRDPMRKVEIKQHLADKRLIMGKTLIERGKVQLGSSTLSKGEKYLLEAIDEVDGIKSTSINPGFLDKMIDEAKKHKEVIESLMTTVPLGDREELGLSFQLAQDAQARMMAVKEKKM